VGIMPKIIWIIIGVVANFIFTGLTFPYVDNRFQLSWRPNRDWKSDKSVIEGTKHEKLISAFVIYYVGWSLGLASWILWEILIFVGRVVVYPVEIWDRIVSDK